MLRRCAILSGLLLAALLVAPSAGIAAEVDESCDGHVALTFDDGPSFYRPQTLQTLRDKRVPATFFDVGMRVAANPQLAGFEAREGHLVLNHTWFHPNLTRLSAAQIRAEVLDTEAALAAAGAPLPFKMIRPPFGALDDAVRAELTAIGYTPILWTVFSIDWDVTTTAEQIHDAIAAGLRPGAVILMHDGPIDSAAGTAVQAALPRIIDTARERGLCFGLLDSTGAVVPAELTPSDEPIPAITNAVPYIPLGSYSGSQLPPKPYRIVTPEYRVGGGLTGRQVTEAADPDGTGAVALRVAGDRVCFGLRWQGIDAPLAAHVHQAPAGQDGPVVVPLFTPDSPAPHQGTGSAWGCTRVDAALATDLVHHPEAYYVDLNTAQYPAGAVRGQLRARPLPVQM